MADTRIFDLTAGTPAAADVTVFTNGTTTYKTEFSSMGNAVIGGGWIQASGSWTYASGTTINIPAGGTSIYSVGDKVKYTQGGTIKYQYVIGAADTLLTVTGGSDHVVENVAITDNYYSKSNSAPGFPQWFNWTPTYGGFSTDPTGITSRFSISGRKVYFVHNEGTNGTSNAGNFTISTPINASTASPYYGGICFFVIDNGTAKTTACRWTVDSSSPTTINIFSDAATSEFTSSGGKRARLQGWYEI